MRPIRYFLLLMNLGMIALILYCGYYFFMEGVLIHRDEKESFFTIAGSEERLIKADKYLPKKDAIPSQTIDRYMQIPVALTQVIAPAEIEVEDRVLEPTGLVVKVLAVAYDQASPQKSGAHIQIGQQNFRFLLVGELLPESGEYCFEKIEIMEDGKSYKLVFSNPQGQTVERMWHSEGRR